MDTYLINFDKTDKTESEKIAFTNWLSMGIETFNLKNVRCPKKFEEIIAEAIFKKVVENEKTVQPIDECFNCSSDDFETIRKEVIEEYISQNSESIIWKSDFDREYYHMKDIIEWYINEYIINKKFQFNIEIKGKDIETVKKKLEEFGINIIDDLNNKEEK